MINKVIGSFVIFLLGCGSQGKNQESGCSSYECRRQNISVSVSPPVIELGQSALLSVSRKKLYLPKMRVYIGDYDEEFQLPPNVTPQYFTGSDTLAFISLAPESAGSKSIRGIVEEYRLVNSDSIDSYRYPFEISLKVIPNNPENQSTF